MLKRGASTTNANNCLPMSFAKNWSPTETLVVGVILRIFGSIGAAKIEDLSAEHVIMFEEQSSGVPSQSH